MDYSRLLKAGSTKTWQTTTAATTSSSRLRSTSSMEQPNELLVRQDQVEDCFGEGGHKPQVSLNTDLVTSEQNLRPRSSPLHDYQTSLQHSEKEHRRKRPFQMPVHSPDIIQDDDGNGDDEWEKSFIGSSATVAANLHQRKDNIDDLTKRYARSLPTAASLVNLLEHDDQDDDLASLPGSREIMDGVFF